MLIEVTLRTHSPHHYLFVPVVRDNRDKPSSFSQLGKLIEDVGHAGKIDDYTINPLKQNLFLLTGFSLRISCRLSQSGTTAETAVEAIPRHCDATRTQLQHDTTVDTGLLRLTIVSCLATVMMVV
jgi:hypothetical protein